MTLKARGKWKVSCKVWSTHLKKAVTVWDKISSQRLQWSKVELHHLPGPLHLENEYIKWNEQKVYSV